MSNNREETPNDIEPVVFVVPTTGETFEIEPSTETNEYVYEAISAERGLNGSIVYKCLIRKKREGEVAGAILFPVDDGNGK